MTASVNVVAALIDIPADVTARTVQSVMSTSAGLLVFNIGELGVKFVWH